MSVKTLPPQWRTSFSSCARASPTPHHPAQFRQDAPPRGTQTGKKLITEDIPNTNSNVPAGVTIKYTSIHVSFSFSLNLCFSVVLLLCDV